MAANRPSTARKMTPGSRARHDLERHPVGLAPVSLCSDVDGALTRDRVGRSDFRVIAGSRFAEELKHY